MSTGNEPNFSLEDMPKFVVGVFQSIDLQPTGGTPPYTCGTSKGTLPAGLTLSDGGVLSGTATTPNDDTAPTVWFIVNDNAGGSGTTAYTVWVVKAAHA